MSLTRFRRLSIERQLPYKTTLTVTYVGTRTLRALRSRNVNAPLPETVVADDPASGVRPIAAGGNILQFESTGRINQNQLIVAVNNRYNDNFSFFMNYTLGRLMSDTEGLGTFPASSYDLSTEYSRASVDARHSFSASGNFNIGWGIRLSPLVIASSGRPFNIITGRDANNDTLFTDRPAWQLTDKARNNYHSLRRFRPEPRARAGHHPAQLRSWPELLCRQHKREPHF